MLILATGCKASESLSGESSPSMNPVPLSRVPVDDLKSAMTPTACEFPPGRMSDGAVDVPGTAAVELAQGADGEIWNLATTLTGRPDRLVRIHCHHGNAAWPDILAVYVDADEPAASLDFRDLDFGDDYRNARIMGAQRSGDTVLLRWVVEYWPETAGGDEPDREYWNAVVSMRGDELVLTNLKKEEW